MFAGFKEAPIGTLTNVTPLNAATLLSIPSGCDVVMLQPLAQNIRVTDDGQTPTSSLGWKITANQIIAFNVVEGATIKIIEETSGATCNVEYYRAHRDTNA